MDFQTEYSTLTKQIDDTLTTQVSSSLTWENVPGGLVKVVSSPGGFAWGYNSNNIVFMCQLPCSGRWQRVELSDYGANTILDITVDYTNVYVLSTSKTDPNKTIMLMNTAANQGQWNVINIPFAAKSIFSTNTYIWAQDNLNNKQKCAKPCTTGNWVVVTVGNDIKITSSTDTELYGTNRAGNAFKTDENMATGWSPIKGYGSSVLKSVLGKVGSTGIYGVDQRSKVFNCVGNCESANDLVPVDTKGYAPLAMSYDPESKYIWMTTTTSSDKGNIFKRLDKPDYTSISKSIDPIDKQRDTIAGDVKKSYSDQTNTLITNKQIQAVVDFFSKQFGYTKSVEEQTKNETTALNKTIQSTQGEIDKKAMISDKLFKIIVTLVIVVFTYLVGESLLGVYIHLIAAVILTGGIIFTIYY